jgi:hypothetical protein
MAHLHPMAVDGQFGDDDAEGAAEPFIVGIVGIVE